MPPSSKRHSLLFVDDDQFFLNLYAQKAKRYNADVETVTSAQAALAKLDSGFKPDAFVLDIDMPGMNGFELVEELKKRGLTEHIYIVFLTNKSDPTYIEKSREYPIDRYIIKATHVPSEVMEEIFDLLESGTKK